jgi:hypothetical protein
MSVLSLLVILFNLTLTSTGWRAPGRPVVAYDCEHRDSTGHVDLAVIARAVRAAHLDGYDFLVAHRTTDWDDLPAFLALADSMGFDAWVTIAPPSEQVRPFIRTVPFGTDYVAWQRAITLLAREHRSLVGLVIDDFSVNDSTFTRNLLARMRAVRDSLGGRPALWGIVYRPTLDSLRQWWKARAGYIDGVIYAYANYSSVDSLAPQLARARADLSGFNAGLGVNVYVKDGPRAPTSRRTTSYLWRAMAIADSLSDLVRLYCMPLGPRTDSLLLTASAYDSVTGHGRKR